MMIAILLLVLVVAAVSVTAAHRAAERAFMSGSNTVSNMLFASHQYEIAVSLASVPPVVILALQNIGGAAGNMICVNNVVAVCATTGVAGCEGRIIRVNLVPCLAYCLVAILVLGMLS